MDRPHAARILSGERSDHARGVDAERRECLEIGLNPGAAARIGAGDGQSDRQPLRHAGRVAAIHSLARCLRIGVERDVGDDGDDVGAGGKTQLRPFDVKSADRDQRDRADAALPHADRLEPLRRERHRLELGRIDRPKRDIVGREGKSSHQLSIVMGADSKSDSRLAHGEHIRLVEIALPEVNPVSSRVDGDFPVIIDNELRARTAADGQRMVGLAAEMVVGRVLYSQLDESRACAHEPSDPGRAVDNGVEGIERAHVSTARPTTGVEGAAMSRDSIGPARKAARPASIA